MIAHVAFATDRSKFANALFPRSDRSLSEKRIDQDPIFFFLIELFVTKFVISINRSTFKFGLMQDNVAIESCRGIVRKTLYN